MIFPESYDLREMHIKRLYILVVFLSGCNLMLLPNCRSQNQGVESQLEKLTELLIKRMSEKGQVVVDFPCIKYDSTLMVNARYDPTCIIIGPIQWAFSSTDDTLSIIYHEYQHHLTYLSKKFPVQYDRAGNVSQWDTGDTYLYEPSEEEVNLQLHRFSKTVLPTWQHASLMPDSIKLKHLETMERDLSKPQTMALIYAPSNLAREEILAYRQQLKGERMGLYQLSNTARTSINIRIQQLKDTLKRRKSYEKAHKLGPDGSKRH